MHAALLGWQSFDPVPRAGRLLLAQRFERWVGVDKRLESRQGRPDRSNTSRGSYSNPDFCSRVMNSCSKLHFW